jgi:allantoicase
MEEFTELIDLLAERLGGAALLASDEFFAPKENLVRASEAVFQADAYTERGKLMDGWESRRKRTPGFDWCILRLGAPGIVRGVVVDTAFFRGNFPEACSIEACSVGGQPAPEALASPQTTWIEILPRSALRGDAKNEFRVDAPWCFTHLRLNIFPDGGVARLRVHGEPMPDWKRISRATGELDLAALEHGGRVLATNDRFFGSAHNLLMPGASTHMGDGWETRRRRGPGFDWAIARLGLRGLVRRAEVETTHFKGNFPESCSLETCSAPDATLEQLTGASVAWRELLPRQKLLAHTKHVFESELGALADASHVRFNIFPDGGVARLRLFGTPSDEGRAAAGMRWLNTLTPAQAEVEFLACCGSTAWARAMSSARPYASANALQAAADRIWPELEPKDWLEAFSRHPKIGEKRAEPRSELATTRAWSEQEQSQARSGSEATLSALARANAEYLAQFGFIFIVCATGKPAEEMLALCRARLANKPEVELRAAAEEQRKITRLRIGKLLGAR